MTFGTCSNCGSDVKLEDCGMVWTNTDDSPTSTYKVFRSRIFCKCKSVCSDVDAELSPHPSAGDRLVEDMEYVTMVWPELLSRED